MPPQTKRRAKSGSFTMVNTGRRTMPMRGMVLLEVSTPFMHMMANQTTSLCLPGMRPVLLIDQLLKLTSLGLIPISELWTVVCLPSMEHTQNNVQNPISTSTSIVIVITFKLISKVSIAATAAAAAAGAATPYLSTTPELLTPYSGPASEILPHGYWGWSPGY
uniref:Uncharacterized protein n=1 Tax=Eutreptiella gymnastica TaxID=73025 RepID=A0A7S1IWZ3_9EUGL